MPEVLPIVPYKAPMVDQDGYVTNLWQGFFRQLFKRVGEARALTNLELADIQDSQLTAIQTDITSLQSSVASLTTQINVIQNDFNLEPLP